jgi:uroporphyrinogen decarboxylase
MNGFERIDAVLNGRTPDYVPVMLHNFLMAAKEYGVNMAQYRSNAKTIADVHIAAVEKYGYDGITVDVDTCTLAGAVGVPVDFPDDEPARTNGAKLERLEDVRQLKQIDISANKRVNIWLEACQRLSKQLKGQVFLRGNCDQAPFSLAAMVRRIENWMIDIFSAENEKYVFELLEYCTDITGQFVKLMAQTGVDMVSNGDSIGGPDMVSPSLYKKYVLPFETKIADIAHKNEVSYLLHICGCVNGILDSMLETGADVLELDYKTDINLIHNKCRNKIVFCGNIDPSGVLAMGSVEDVKVKTSELLEIYSDSHKFILNTGCAIPSSTPPENLKMMIALARNFKI